MHFWDLKRAGIQMGWYQYNTASIWDNNENPIEDIFATKNYRLLYVAIPQVKALKMGQTLTFIESSAFKARLEQAEVLKS